jgi:hypothetical protein
MLQYSRILNDPAMTFVNVVGVSLNLCYVLCYYIYSENKVNSSLIFSHISLSTYKVHFKGLWTGGSVPLLCRGRQ